MFTKYTTGQQVFIPGTIRSAREENGQIIYEVDTGSWRGVPEQNILVDSAASAKVAFDNAMAQLTRDIY